VLPAAEHAGVHQPGIGLAPSAGGEGSAGEGEGESAARKDALRTIQTCLWMTHGSLLIGRLNT
jgi:hypothetical protein